MGFRSEPAGKWGRAILGYVVCLILFLAVMATAAGKPQTNEFDLLKKRLVKDGFKPTFVEKVYANPEVAFETKGVSLFFVHSESTLDYDQFLAEKNIRNAKKYMKSHRTTLISAKKAYGVDPEVITAILLVETKLGKYKGKRSILNTLSTMAALNDSGIRADFWKQVPQPGRLSREKFEAKADKKSNWAYVELKSYLKYTAREGIPPSALRGSYAGAFGICQFMPSNALTLAKDGNGDGKVDLFNHTDAIFSIANYLKHHGWRPGIERNTAYKVVLRYNYSKYYANTILKISERLSDA